MDDLWTESRLVHEWNVRDLRHGEVHLLWDEAQQRSSQSLGLGHLLD